MTFDFYKFTAQVACVFVFWFCAFAFIMNDGKEWGQDFSGHGRGRATHQRAPVLSSVKSYPGSVKGPLPEPGNRHVEPPSVQDLHRIILPVPSETALNMKRRDRFESGDDETIRMFTIAEEMSSFLPYEPRLRGSKYYSQPFTGGQYVVRKRYE